MTLTKKRDLMDTANDHGVTLDGKRAVVAGARNDFATVATLDGSAQHEWSWEAIERAILGYGRGLNFRA